MPQDPMLFAQIESFVEVARLGNVSRAAEALFLTQPAITARLKSLERALGVELFVRTHRGMKLSDAGRAFLPYAQRAIATLDEARQLIANLREGTTGALVIAAAPAVSTYVLPAVLRAFRATHPNVRLGVRTGHTEEVLDMVLRGEAHVGVGRPVRHADAELIPLFEDEMLLVVSARHPFAPRGKVRMDELAQERLILFDRTSSYHELTSSLFRQAGVVPASTLELDNVEAAKKMVQQGLGVALLPRMALAQELRARSLRPVKMIGAPPVRRPIVALRRRDAGEALGPVAAILDLLKGTRL
ncbi:MAG TPA: LysR family transcriptional regulator [Candidatus Limnocylindria bacterium]|nr:LysR family transcriptional regulator [Candidatus Limnocylindria bacterium]